MKLQSKILLLVFCPLILQIGILLEISHLLREAENALDQQLKVTRIQYFSSCLQKELGQSLSIAFMYRITGKEALGPRLSAALENLPPIANNLYTSLSAVGYDSKSLLRLHSLVDQSVAMGQRILVDDPTSRLKAERLEFTKTGASTIKALSDESAHIDEFAQSLNREPEVATNARNRVVIFIYMAFVADLLLAFGIGIANIKSIVNRIKILKDNTLRFSLDQPLNDSVGGADEITELDNFFQMMAISLKDSNKRQKALLENTADILCSLDRDGRFVSVNAAAKKVWGYEPSSLLNKSVLLSIKKEDRESTHKHLKKAIDYSIAQVFDSYTITNSGIAAEMRWSVFWSESDKSLFCVVRDVSRENELARMKQALMDTAAHDLRAPLTAIVSTLSNLSMGVLGPLPSEVQSKIEKTEKQASRLVRLVSDLLDNEALTAGKMSYVKAIAELKPLLNESISSLQSIAESKEIDILVDAPSGVFIDIDRDRIFQVLVNLLSNALKYSKNGSSITVSAKRTQMPTELLTVKVIDEGIGINNSRKKSVFDRFATTESEERSAAVKNLKGDQQASSGLGLSICKAIIEDHGGEIGVTDTPGGGSTFWFTLPVGD